MIWKKWVAPLIFTLILLGCQSTETTAPAGDHLQNDPDHASIEVENSNTESENNKPAATEVKASDELTLHYIDAGQGDATLLEYHGDDEDYNILYDTGDWLGSEVVPYLEKEQIEELDIVIISHPHADHIGQLKQVMENVTVDEVWMSGNSSSSTVFTEAMEAVTDSGAAYEEPKAGDIYDVGPLVLTILHPDTLTGDLNADSLSVHFQFGETAFVFTGDAYIEGEQAMISRDVPLQANVLQLGHHGSNTSSSEAFINAVQPDFGIYSAGVDNSYGHPHKETVSLFENKGIPLYGTDEYGNIIVTSDGESVEVTTEKDAPEKKISQPTPSPEKEDSVESEKESTSAADCIDINEASLSELTEIVHIGEARAEELIEKRPYETLDQLNGINGIAAKRLADIKAENKACIGGNE